MAGKGAALAMVLSARDEGVAGVLGGIDKQVSSFGESLKGAFAGLGALGIVEGITSGITSIVGGAIEAADATGRLQAQLGLTADQAAELGQVAQNVFRGGFGESASEVNAALATVRQNLGDIGAEAIQGATEAALTLKDLFGAAETESTRTVSVMMKNFDGLSETQAFDIITAGYQSGLDFSGEYLDSLREYSPQFAKLGYSAEQMFAIFKGGAEGGAFNLDKVGDAMKEFAIRAIDGSKLSAEGYKLLGLDAEQMTATIAAGGPAAQKATEQVLTALANMTDPVKQNTAGVALFGTQWEDLGPAALLAMNQAGAGVEGLEGATARAAAASFGLAGQWESLKRTVVGFLVDAITPLMPSITAFVSGAIGQMQALIPVIATIGTALADIFNGGDSFDVASEWLEKILPRGAADMIIETFVLIGDGWRTVVQVFQNDWAPDASINPLVNALGMLATVIRDVVIPAVLVFGAFVVEQFSTVVDWVVANWPLIQQVIAQVLVGIQILWERYGAQIVTIVQSAWAIVTNIISGALDIVLSLITTAMQLMTGDVEGAMTTLGGLFERTWARLGEIVSAAWSAILAAIDIGTGGALSAISSWVSSMGDAVTSGLDGIVAAFTGWGNTLVTLIVGVGAMAVSAAANLGANIVNGIVGGIYAGIGSVREAAANMVQGAIDAAFAAAESHSPSEVFKRLGVSMPDGLVIGVGSRQADVQAAANALLAPFLELGPGAVQWFKDFQAAAAGYAAVAGEIKRVEGEIATIRDQSQTDALFRAQEMVDIDSESLRLKQAQVSLERDLIPLRQDLARATQQVADIERGSLSERTGLIEMDGERKKLRLEQIELEKQLIGLDSGSKKAAAIKEQIDRLREQDRALSLEAERIRLNNEIAATGARVRREQLDDQARGQQAVIDLIRSQIDVLAGERAVFDANEAVIKNATENEIAYRERLIAVFKSEGKPLLDRIQAGLGLIDQMEAEGIVSKELAAQLRAVAEQASAGSSSTTKLAGAAEEAAKSFDGLGDSLGDLPDWFQSKVEPVFKPDKRAAGGPVSAGIPYLVGERGPELFVPGGSGRILPSGSFGGGGGQTVVNVTVQGSLIHERDLEQVVLNAMGGGMRRGLTLGVR